ncbi:hypothetical protein QQF64_015538 [Cirrhinus molitorella]|uniref:C-type lectin domain-containing protein n=1 Tax=Cirrhinus molitorella TaxID=172907 RepID=A0ABR3NV66_9TELE
MSWPEAQSYCRERFTDLATVESEDDVNRLVNIADARYSGSVWIGLKRGAQKRWAWSNGEDTTSQYYNWGPSQPNGDEDCVTYNSGAWHNVRCDHLLDFACDNENTEYIIVQSSKTWTDAQSYCRQHYTDLPTIHNSEENNQITKQIIMSDAWYVWIGLFRDSWEWSDKSSLFFRHWATGQPSQSSGSGDCVGMSSTDSGKWVHESCDLQQPFICHGDEKLLRNQIVRLKLSCNGKCTLNDPSLQTDVLNEISEKLKSMGLKDESKISWRKSVSSGETISEKLKSMGLESESKISWIKKEGEEVFHEENNFMANSNNASNNQRLFWSSSAVSRQYHYVNTVMSWSEAQSYCRERFTDLATVDSMDDVNRLVNLADAGYSGSVWIGLKRGTQKRWGWSAGESKTQYFNWASGQPDWDGDCVVTHSGVWHDTLCDYKRYFVCYVENSGYIMVQSAKIWSDAQSYCRQNYRDLPTIHNSVENNQIKQILLSGYYIWIGLFQDSWEWSDKSSRLFRHWAKGQPSQSSGSGDCVGMTKNNSGKWAQHSCDLRQPFVCHGGCLLKQLDVAQPYSEKFPTASTGFEQ